MKIWWPWRKKKVLSLFARPDEPHNSGCSLPPVATRSVEPYPKNAPGPFYVINAECITCGAPHVAAPDLMAWDYDNEGRVAHCYFKKQPQTAAEIEHAVNAMAVSCCGALVYDGSDPEIIKRLGT